MGHAWWSFSPLFCFDWPDDRRTPVAGEGIRWVHGSAVSHICLFYSLCCLIFLEAICITSFIIFNNILQNCNRVLADKVEVPYVNSWNQGYDHRGCGAAPSACVLPPPWTTPSPALQSPPQVSQLWCGDHMLHASPTNLGRWGGGRNAADRVGRLYPRVTLLANTSRVALGWTSRPFPCSSCSCWSPGKCKERAGRLHP